MLLLLQKQGKPLSRKRGIKMTKVIIHDRDNAELIKLNLTEEQIKLLNWLRHENIIDDYIYNIHFLNEDEEFEKI